MKIILADDQEIVRIGVKILILKTYPNAQIHEVDNGTALLIAIKNEDWDLVISDNVMPDKNGLEVLAEIRLIKPHLPFLILSGQNENEQGLIAIKLGASGYLNKLDVESKLNVAIKTILHGEKYVSENLQNIININTPPY